MSFPNFSAVNGLFEHPEFCSTPAILPITPNSSYDQIVSPCFAKVLAPSFPIPLALASFFIISLRQFYGDPPSGVSRLALEKLSLIKLFLSLLTCVISVGDVLLTLTLPNYLGISPVLPEQHNAAFLGLLFSICALLIYVQCIRLGIVSSGWLHLAWFLRLISLLPDTVLSFAASEREVQEVPANVCVYAQLTIALCFVLVLAKADRSVAAYRNYHRLDNDSSNGVGIQIGGDQSGGARKSKEECPEGTSSALSYLLFWYASAMVWRGLRGTVNFDHLWALDKPFQAEYLRRRFYKHHKTDRPLTICSFFFRLFLSVWEWNCLAIFASFFVVAGRYGNALFLRVIVRSVEDNNPLWLSLVALCMLFFVDFSGKLITVRRDFSSFRAFLNLRSVLTTLLFDKMIRLSASSRGKYSVGEIQNLLNTDVYRVRYMFFVLRDFIYCPLMVCVALLGLFMEIGNNTFYGVGILVAILPVNFVLSKVSSRLEEKQMKIKDERLKLMNDVLSGMRVLKLYAWEKSMQKMIFELRKRELSVLRKLFFVDAAINVSFDLAPLIATFISFLGYTILQGRVLTPDVAFVTLLFFAMLRYSIYQIPQMVTNTIRACVSAKRLVEFLNSGEQQPSHILQQTLEEGQSIVSLRNSSFSWADTKSPNPTLQLRNISLEVRQGELVGIVGKVGAGKSSLLSAVLGEMERVESAESEVVVRARSLGYVPQQPWIQNRTLRSNVLFDLPFNENRYAVVIGACALKDDLHLLQAGDMTEIGEKGINLSGGQKARVALARAVYMDAELYILDDTLSAVDAHVGAHIFEHVLGAKGLLAAKTRLWALNSLAFLQHCSRIVVMDRGEINTIGTLDQLKQQREGPFADLIKEFMEKKLESQRSRGLKSRSIGSSGRPEEEDEEDQELSEVLEQFSGSPLSESLLEHRQRLEQQQQNELASATAAASRPTNAPTQNTGTTVQTAATSTTQDTQSQQQVVPVLHHSQDHSDQPEWTEVVGRLTKEEELATGIVPRRVYLTYFRSFGIFLSISYVVIVFLGISTFEALASFKLAQWSSSASNSSESLHYLAVYGGLNMVFVISTAISSVIIAVGAYQASTYFHDRLVYSLFRSPMSFFDQTPLGRIINRLSNDIDKIDENIPWAISIAMLVFAEALNSLISICIGIPLLLVVVLPLLVIFLGIIHFYNVASVQFRRLTSKSVSSTCAFFQDSHLGADSIRVFNVVERFRNKSCHLSDFMNESLITEIFTNRWLQTRLDMISDIAICFCVLVSIIMANNNLITLGILALVISSGYTFSGYLGEIARVWRESEVQMVCVERVTEYINNKHEGEWRVPNVGETLNWPPRSAGRLQFQNLYLRYRDELDFVLNNLNFEVQPGEKVGIVGRTGAGKSSLTLALFRIVEPASGKILINGVDICSLGLHDLRNSLTIIPQDPVLFCGTIRTNLDPFDEHTDDKLWEALQKAHLAEAVKEMDGGLTYVVAESGSNLSVGQKQLLCLARAMLRSNTCILVLDEATAAIDPETDSRIQSSIRNEFNNCTVLTIAHRLNTILDYDRVLVMNAGQVAEYDTPAALLKKPESQFFQLAKQAGISSDDIVKQ